MPNRRDRALARITVWSLALAAMVFADCYAKCVGLPATSHIRADVKVWSCVAVTFGAVNRQFYALGPLYENGASFSGTLMAIEVNSSQVIWDVEGSHKKSDSSRPWKSGKPLTLFVPASAEQTCPSALPSDLTVETRDQCCDTLPMHGQCLVPRYLQIAVVVAK
jgi:hypothetical protein